MPAELHHGHRLNHNQEIQSGNKLYRLVHQADGNVVIYAPGNKPIWATNTCGHATTHFDFQHDGNLVLYNGTHPVWASNTCGSGADKVSMQNDGNLVVYHGGSPKWASNTTHQLADHLAVDQHLRHGDAIKSADHQFSLIHQQDGNVVVYGPHGNALWASNTAGRATTHLVLQHDGNLVLYDHSTPVWASNTCGSGAERLVLQNDDNLVLYDGNKPKWARR
jgi:hypothetical protein